MRVFLRLDTMSQKFTNNATALITSNITTGSLSFTIESAFADRYPALVSGDWFVGTLQNIAGDIEVIRVNKRDVGSNAIQNVVRAQEGTTALTFSAGEAVFSVRATAAHHQGVADHVVSNTAAHSAAAITFFPTDDITSSTVQSAIEEVRADAATMDATRAATAASAALLKVAITDLVAQTHTNYTSSGAAPAFAITPTPAITAYTPGIRYQVTAHAASTPLTTNTLNVSGLGALSIKRYSGGGSKLAATFSAGQILEVMFDGADFVVLNATQVFDEPPGDIRISMSPTQAPGTRRVLVQGQAILMASYPTLEFLWCGSLLNSHIDPLERADFFYRCSDPLNPNTTRGDSGAYLLLPPAGYFLRPINTGSTGADASRKRFKLQEDDNKAHTHGMNLTPYTNYTPDNWTGASSPYNAANTLNTASSGSEGRPKNFGAYVWLCY